VVEGVFIARIRTSCGLTGITVLYSSQAVPQLQLSWHCLAGGKKAVKPETAKSVITPEAAAAAGKAAAAPVLKKLEQQQTKPKGPVAVLPEDDEDEEDDEDDEEDEDDDEVGFG
jgi:hypothetical protein